VSLGAGARGYFSVTRTDKSIQPNLLFPALSPLWERALLTQAGLRLYLFVFIV